MKVLYITLENMSLHKGSVVHVKEVVAGLRKRGHQVGLIARAWDKPVDTDPFYNIHYSVFFPLRFLGVKRKLYFISLALLFVYLIKVLPQYDVIYAREFHAAIVAFFPRLIFNKKLIFEINGLAHEEIRLEGGSWLNRIFSFFIRHGERMATKYSDRIVSVTPQIASFLIHHFRCPPGKLRVVGNGVNTRMFHPIRDEASLSHWKEKLGIAQDEVVIVFVGNLARWQGVECLVESAFRLLSSREERMKFLIIGDGPIRKDLMRRVSDSGFARVFIFTGMMHYKDIPFVINVADICVAPFISRRNRKTGVSPLKIFEYMACGKPVVASRVEGLEFIEDEGTGRLVEPEDAISLEKALYDLIKTPPQRIKMGERGVRIACEKFSWESVATKIEEVLRELA